MVKQQFIRKYGINKQQKLFLIGNNFLLLFVVFTYLMHLFTKSLNLVLCPMKMIANIPCPFCGGTRCALSFLSLDFKSSFMYHPATMVLMIYAIFLELV